MIHVVGLDSDKTVIHFVSQARMYGVDIKFINLREIVDNGDWYIAIPDGGSSWLKTSDRLFSLDPNGNYYCRIIDLSNVQQDTQKAVKWRGLVSALNYWLEHIPGIVINRPGIYSDNFSKPLHEKTLGSLGFNVPLSLTSSDAGKLMSFASISPSIVKSVSGVMSTTRLVTADEFENFDPRQGPVHLQRYIMGSDVRAHTIGEQVYAESVISSGIDYRKRNESNHHSVCMLSDELIEKIVSTTKVFGLTFMGWDFKVDSNGTYWCLEANPMPGYHSYDRTAESRITKALITALTP